MALGGTENQAWYGLFKKIDDNNDNHISLVEFKKMVRDNMRAVNVVGQKDRSAWRSLDLDEDGLIDAGCFGRFYRRVEIANGEYLRIVVKKAMSMESVGLFGCRKLLLAWSVMLPRTCTGNHDPSLRRKR